MAYPAPIQLGLNNHMVNNICIKMKILKTLDQVSAKEFCTIWRLALYSTVHRVHFTTAFNPFFLEYKQGFYKKLSFDT